MNYLRYPYSYDSYGGLLVGGAEMIVIFVLIAIAAIVAVVVGYIFFLGKNASKRDSKLGSFLNFNSYWLDKIIKVIYLISVVSIAAGCIYMWLSATIAGGVVGFLVGLIGAAVAFFISQLLCRITFESVMLFVQVAMDTRAIRNEIAGSPVDAHAAAQERKASASGGAGSNPYAGAYAATNTANTAYGSQPAAANAAGAADVAGRTASYEAPQSAYGATGNPVAPEGASVQQPAQAERDEQGWTCASCGTHVPSGRFCATCGTPRP